MLQAKLKLSCIPLFQESFNRLSYLLDVFTFTQDDMSLNSTVLNWPNNIAPIFDQNDEVIKFVLMESENNRSIVNLSYCNTMLDYAAVILDKLEISVVTLTAPTKPINSFWVSVLARK